MRTFDGVVITTEKFLAIIAVHMIFFVCFRINRIAGLFINLNQKNTAGPGAINHPHTPVFIVKNIRVNTVWPVIIVIRRCCIWPRVCSHQFFDITFLNIMIAITRVQECVLIVIRTFNIICCCKADIGFHIRRCGAEIHHVFSHFFVIDDIRCPYGITTFLVLSYISKRCRIAVFFSVKKIVKQLILCIDPGGKTGPVSQICRLRRFHMGAKDIVSVIVFDDRWIMHGSSGSKATFLNLALNIICACCFFFVCRICCLCCAISSFRSIYTLCSEKHHSCQPQDHSPFFSHTSSPVFQILSHLRLH